MTELSAIGAKTSGSIEEIQIRLATYKKTPGLYEAMFEATNKRQRKKVFGRELQVDELPDSRFEWKCDSFPTFTSQQIKQYTCGKLSGKQSLLKKARAFYNSRKIVTIRSSEEKDNVIWIRAYVEKSFGSEQRPLYIKFVEMKAVGAYCACRIGTSGLCAHIIAVLFNLKHKTDYGQFLLAVTATCKRQKWHKKGLVRQKKYDPIQRYEVKNAVRERNIKKKKRDITKDVEDISKQLDSCEVELHFLRTIGTGSSRMRNGGLYPILAHRHIYNHAQKEHDYVPISKPEGSGTSENDHNYTPPKDTAVPGPSTSNIHAPVDAVRYFEVKQGSEEWHKIRKSRVTASKAGDLIGLGGKSKFVMEWKVLAGECKAQSKNFTNFQRGISFESVARKKFNNESGIDCLVRLN